MEERVEMGRIRDELERVTLLEEISWRQKSRALCIREGDRNTKFFHRIANSHKRVNSIDRLMVDGVLSLDPAAIADCISQFYRRLYSEDMAHRPVLDDVDFSSISVEDASWLDRPFEEEEVFGVITDFNGDKAPGLDGFSMAFFQSCWSVLKTEIMAIFHNFHTQGVFEKSLNALFLALIPKKVDAEEVKDFRPISLVGGIYKIISKVLANRLRRVAHGIISDSQNAFVKGRQILDSVLIGSECIDSRLKSGVLGMLCKLDVEKAYDHVSWDFLMYMLQRCGFSEKWRKWIRDCISIVKFSILINGSPTDFFGSSRGFRQGDPLSPLLFDIVMEALSRMLDVAASAGQFSGFSVGSTVGPSVMVSHLLFADDILIFCDVELTQIANLRVILARFEEVSGLRINLGKSELVPVGGVPNLEALVGLVGCGQSSLPLKYLGLPLDVKFKDLFVWNPILERMERRLAGWKRMYLSKRGKVTLIKSSLLSLPTYFLSLLPLPGKVAKRMEKL